jgi:hypothetical protein
VGSTHCGTCTQLQSVGVTTLETTQTESRPPFSLAFRSYHHKEFKYRVATEQAVKNLAITEYFWDSEEWSAFVSSAVIVALIPVPGINFSVVVTNTT